MFRQEEIFCGGWQDKTIDAMQKRRFNQVVAQLPPLGAGRLENLSCSAFERKLEQCWQDIERKPMRKQQEAEVWRAIISTIEKQADCLAQDEHDLVERALILGGSVQIEDAAELEAARALSMRLWASVGLVSGKPYMELEAPVIRPAAKAFARAEHEVIRARFDVFQRYMESELYRLGAVDDRWPQHVLLHEVFGIDDASEMSLQLARRYLWASFDCLDYRGGVLLIHRALAELQCDVLNEKNMKRTPFLIGKDKTVVYDILPEEIPLQNRLVKTLQGALRSNLNSESIAKTLRYLCKQGAPLNALEEVLQSSLIVYLTPPMRSALRDMYYSVPKWFVCSEKKSLQ